MKIFMCHSGTQKLLAKEIKKNLPHPIGGWIDEFEIAAGEQISSTIRKAIREECNYFIVIIDEYAIKSGWVRNEIKWALKREKELNKVFFIPIVLDRNAWKKLDPSLRARKYLKCKLTDPKTDTLVKELTAELLVLMCRELDDKNKIENFPVHQRDNLLGAWKSSWGPLPKGPVKHHEDLKIYRQHGYELWGTATRHGEPNKKWEVRGRYDSQFLQLYYYPSSDSVDIDFLDFGCYFFKRNSQGVFEGCSTGYGKSNKEVISTDYHELFRIKRKKVK